MVLFLCSKVDTKVDTNKNGLVDIKGFQSSQMKQMKREKRGKSTHTDYSNTFDIVGVIGSSPTNPTAGSLIDQGLPVFL